jgi:hypothetical protein
MVDYGRDFIEVNLTRQGVNDPMAQNVPATDFNREPLALLAGAPSGFAGHVSVGSASDLFVSEVPSRPGLPEKRAGLLIEEKAFRQKIESEHDQTSVKPAVLVFSQRPAAQRAEAGARSTDGDVPPTIGDLAVRLLAEWSLPRMRLLGSSGRDDDPSAR